MRIILVTADNLEHIYVANKLAEAIPLSSIIIDHGRRISLLAKARRLWRKYTVRQLLSRVHVAVMTRIWRDEAIGRSSMLAAYGAENCLKFSHPELLQHIHGINTPDGTRAVASTSPDVLLIYGTVLVSSRVLSLAKVIALNMHTGISPNYRGADCAFWPLYNGELEMVGATVHECTRDIDGGRIFGTARARLRPEDDVFSVFARSVIAGADLYAAKVKELLAGDLNGIRQDLSLGREYRACERSVAAEQMVRKRIREGLIKRFANAVPEADLHG
ncbi:MAG TPA: formyl transferase [Candidatus Acidoferrales bacterium]|nr:formyl transferase [Candidatus Acidoferrales bacterium]